MNITNLTDVVGNRRKEEVVAMLQSALARVEEGGASDVLILLKADDRYLRYSTKLETVTEVIAQLEILKYDILRRMHE
jgi:hypothetical protein|tara:strand:- start:3208 stop:3441 length:234 start_codon:yes stop_codon:yes gene_type:complete